MIKAVIDTNVFLSAIFWGGKPKEVLRLIFSKRIIGVTSPAILEEIENKLIQKFNYPKEQAEEYLKLIIENFHVVNPELKVDIVEDPKDNKIIEAAIEAGADFIITGDRHLLKIKGYEGIEIIAPNEFLSRV